MIHGNKIERTTIVERASYHEVRTAIIRNTRLNCRNRASKIQQAHGTITRAARTNHYNRAPKL